MYDKITILAKTFIFSVVGIFCSAEICDAKNPLFCCYYIVAKIKPNLIKQEWTLNKIKLLLKTQKKCKYVF